jgi:sarcosine oxidase subunit beta
MEEVVTALVELFPAYSRLRLMRQWSGTVDISPDTSPILGKTPVENLYLDCGFGTGGYKSIPAAGETMATPSLTTAAPSDRAARLTA